MIRLLFLVVVVVLLLFVLPTTRALQTNRNKKKGKNTPFPTKFPTKRPKKSSGELARAEGGEEREERTNDDEMRF